jgi:hypothetical protein
MVKKQYLKCVTDRFERVKHGSSYYWYGMYEPGNVRWATAKENANNQQRHKRRKKS